MLAQPHAGASKKDRKELSRFEVHLVDIAGVRFADILPNDGIGHMFARVRVAFAKPYTGLAVADRAVVTLQGDKFLYVVNDINTVEERPVDLGRLIAPGLRHVRAGLQALPAPSPADARG